MASEIFFHRDNKKDDAADGTPESNLDEAAKLHNDKLVADHHANVQHHSASRNRARCSLILAQELTMTIGVETIFILLLNAQSSCEEKMAEHAALAQTDERILFGEYVAYHQIHRG